MKTLILLMFLVPSLAIAQRFDFEDEAPTYRVMPVPQYPTELQRKVPSYWEAQNERRRNSDDYYQYEMLKEQRRQNDLLERQIYQNEDPIFLHNRRKGEREDY